MMAEPIHILLVEDNPDHAELIRRVLERQSRPVQVTAVGSGADCLEMLRHHSYSAVLLDYTLSGMDGLTVLKKIRQQGHTPPVIMVTGQGDEAVVVEAMQEGASDYLIKTTGYLTTLPAMLFKVLKQHELAGDNVRLLEETRQRAQEAEALQAIAEAVSRSLNTEEILKQAVEKVVEVARANTCVIRLREGDELVAKVSWSREGRPLPEAELRRKLGEGPSGQVVMTGKPLLIDREEPTSSIMTSKWLQKRSRMVAVAPILIRGEVVGTLGFGAPNLPSSRALEFLKAVGDQVGIALEHARLFEESRQAYQELQTLYDVSQSVLSSLELKTVLEGILDKALSIGPFDLGNIRLFDPSAELLEVVASRGYRDPENIQRHRQQARDPKTGEFNLKVFSREGPYVEENVPASDGLRTLKREGIQSAVLVPVRAGDEVLGYLQLGSRPPRKFKPEQVHLLEAIGNQMGIAVQKAELYERTKRAAEIQGFLKELSQDITSLEIGSLLKKLTEKVREVFKADISDIRVVEQGAWRVMGVSGIEPHLLAPSHGGALRGLSGRVLQQRQPLMVPDVMKTDLSTGTILKNLGVHGYLGAPLFSRMGEVIGILRALTYQPRVFSQEEIDLLQQLANGAAIAIENARLFEETERRAREQEVLNLIAGATNRSLDLKEILQIALDKVLEVTGRERGYIRLKDPVTGEVTLAVHRGVSEDYIETLLRGRTPGGKTDQVFQSGEPLVVNDPEGTVLKDETRREGSSSLVWIPLKARGRVVGILNVATAQPLPFTPREVELLQAIGSVIGVALENARLFGETKISLERVGVLREIEAAITSTLDLRALLDALLGKIERLLPYSGAAIRLLNRETGKLEILTSHNLDAGAWRALKPEGASGISQAVVENKAPVVINDLRTDPRVRDPEFVRREGMVSFLGLPLIAQGEPLGVLSFFTKGRGHEFGSEEVEFLTTLAGQVAMAIYNSQLYEAIKKQAVEMERANKVKTEFLSVMSHELRTPLTSVLGYAAMMQDEVFGAINPEHDKALRMIVQQSQELLAMISSIMDATKIESGAAQVERHEFPLRGLLDDLKSTYDYAKDEGITLIWDYPSNLPVVNTDSEKLKHILQNLINNAIKFTPKGRVAISARILERDQPQAEGNGRLGLVEFRVRDTGIGIPPKSLPAIFDMFRQVDSSETRGHGGVGLGLYIVKRFTEMLGGKVEVESKPGKGSIFTVTIPKEI